MTVEVIAIGEQKYVIRLGLSLIVSYDTIISRQTIKKPFHY